MRQLVSWLSLDIFRGDFFPHFPVRAISRRPGPFTRDARGRGRMDRGDTGTDAGPADRTTRSTPARQQGTTPAARHPRTVTCSRQDSHPQNARNRGPETTRAASGERHPQPIKRRHTRRRRTTPGSAAALILGKCTQEGPQQGREARFYCFPVSRTTGSSKRRRRPHARPPNFGNVARLYRQYSRGQCSTGATGANSGEATQPTRTAAHQEPQKARRRPAAAFISFTW